MKSRLFALLLLTALPLLADEPLAPVENGPAYGHQSVHSIGANQRGLTFVVWEDRRDDYAMLRGSRVGEHGELVDPFGIEIAPITGYPWRVKVLPDGDGWRVEYEEAPGVQPRRGYRIDAKGVVSPGPEAPWQAPFRHELLGNPNTLRAWNGEETLLIGRRTRHEVSQLVTFRLDRSGQLIGEPVIFPPVADFGGTLLDLEWAGEDWVLLFRNGPNELRVARIDRTGAPIGTFVAVPERTYYTPDTQLATRNDGTVAFIYRNEAEALRVARLAGTSLRISDPITTDPITAGAAIAGTPAGYMIAWTVAGGVAVSPMTLDLALHERHENEETLSANAQKNFDSDRTSEARLLVWHEEDGRRIGRLMAQRPGSSEKFSLLPSDLDQRAPAIARIGDSHFVVWYEIGETSMAVKGMFFDLFDEPLLHEPVLLGTSLLTPAGFGPYVEPVPSVVWTGHYFLVAWNSGSQVQLTRVTAGGVVVHKEPALPATQFSQFRPRLVRAGSQVYLVFQTSELEAPCIVGLCAIAPAQVMAMRYDLAGNRIDITPISIGSEPFSSRADAAWNGHTLLVTYVRHETLYAREVHPFYVGEERKIAEGASSGSVIAVDGEFVIVKNAKLWRDASGIRTATEKLIEGVPRIYVDSISRNSSSESTVTLSDFAFSSFDPAASPATR